MMNHMENHMENLNLNPVTTAKELEQSFFTGMDWDDPVNEPITAFFAYADRLNELVEQVNEMGSEYARIMRLLVSDRKGGNQQ